MDLDTNNGEMKSRLAELVNVADMLPGVVIIHNLQGAVVWMSEDGLVQLGITLQEVVKMSPDEYYRTFFNEEDARDYVPKILSLLERNNDKEFCTYFQQVRYKGDTDWTWFMSSTRIFARNEEGKPVLTITMAFPLEAMHHMQNKADRLLEENNFLRENFQRFANLSLRERDVLKLLAMGKTAPETAEELFISVNTVESHRKNIRKKLNVNSLYELGQYARSFDLI